MKITIVAAVAFLLAGCSSPKSAPEPIRSIPMESSDIKVATRFLDALCRPRHSPDRIIVDASAEEGYAHIPLGVRNRELASRLDMLRQPPERLRLVINSGDRPEPFGSSHFIFEYDRLTGKLTSLGLHIAGADTYDSSNMWLDIRHWPGGTRLVCVRFSWINDQKNDTFHLRQGESKFRFADSSFPLID